MVSIDYLRSKRSSTHQPLGDDRPAKRISTPAGQRLSVILDATRSKSPSATAKINVTTTSTYCNDPNHTHIGPVQHGHKTAKKSGMVSVLTGGRLGDTPRESSEEQSHNGSNLSVSVWSDKDAEKFGQIRQQKRRGIAAWGWKKIVIIAALIIALLVALAVGLAIGLKKKTTSRYGGCMRSRLNQQLTDISSTSATTTTDNTQPAVSGPSTSTSTSSDLPPASPTNTLTPSTAPSNFPVGAYSLVTFLDNTVTTDCTSDVATWTCAPYTSYYDDPQKALAVFNWEISGSTGAYKISSKGQDATFGTTFQNEKLELLDAGKSTERYRFQISRSKTVNMTGSIGEETGDFECDYGATNLQGILYTQMQRTFPDDTIAVSNAASSAWPYGECPSHYFEMNCLTSLTAVKIEQSASGGVGVPSCKKSSGEKVTKGLEDQKTSTLCSCLYRNWNPT